MDKDITPARIAEFLEQGFLDILVGLFRSDSSLYGHLGDLLRDERFVVRLGATALVETLAEADPDRRGRAAAMILPLLESDNPTHRGDAAYLLGVVGVRETSAALQRAAASDAHVAVREIAREAVERLATAQDDRPALPG